MSGLTRRRILFSAAALTLALFVAVAVGWFYLLAPRRRIMNEEWRERHSDREVWAVGQKAIARTGWFHDAPYAWGDKGLATWLIEGMRPGESITCFGGHKDAALRQLTNQNAGTTAEAWQEWWAKNSHKTQEEWIREGFGQGGVVLHSPLTKADVVALLRVMGKHAMRKRAMLKDEGSPSSWSYNAFRWLRDSDFDPSSLTTADLPQEDPDEVLQGLIVFAGWEGRWPKRQAPLVLALGEPVVEWPNSAPPVASPWFDAGAYCVLALLLGGGIACLRLALRHKVVPTGHSEQPGAQAREER